jgi:uncharacterized protein (DUF736 family)
MDFIGQIALAEDGEFQGRVRQAVVTAAVEIMADQPDNTPQAIATHAKRAALANRVLLDPVSLQRAWAYMAASNVSISDESTDSDLQWTVNAMWNAMAGVVLEP